MKHNKSNNKSNNKPKQETELMRWPGEVLQLTRARAGSWLSIAWIMDGIEMIMTGVVLIQNLVQDKSTTREWLIDIICAAQALSMFASMTIMLLSSCRRYGYNDETGRWLHPLHESVLKNTRPLRNTMTPTMKVILTLVTVPFAAVFTAALWLEEQAVPLLEIVRVLAVVQMAMIAILYGRVLVDWRSYRWLKRTQNSELSFREFAQMFDRYN